MSRSNPTLTNPATRFFEWKGSTGTLEFYDKEQEKRITVPLPFSFLPLDELATITGYSSRAKSSYWSNEVRNIKNDSLTVRSKNGVEQEGLYDTLADVRAKGAKYAKSIYIAYKTKAGWQIGNIKAHGSALSSWIDFTGSYIPQNGKVTLTRGDVLQTPKGDDYYPPVFQYESATAEEDGIAISLDRELQTYLNTYLAAANFNRSNDDQPIEDDEPITAGTDRETETQSGYEKAKAESDRLKAKKAEAPEEAAAMETYAIIAGREASQEDEINLDDIPF